MEFVGDKYNLFMIEEFNLEGLDLCGGVCVSFGLFCKEVLELGLIMFW